MSETCLVTGGAGFIGSHLVDDLAAGGFHVRVLDDFSTGLRDNLLGSKPYVEVVNGDIADEHAVRKAMKDVGVVFHLAALASVARSVEAPLTTHRACATGTLNVLDAARLSGVRRMVFAASSSAYGGLSSEEGQREDAPIRPMSPYAAAKLSGELYLQAFAHTYGIETVALRFFNIFGPRQRADSPYSGVIALFIDAMTNGRQPTILGDGLQSRDFTFVSNAVKALRCAATAPDVSGQVFNVGTGASVTLLDLVRELNRLLGADIQPLFGPERTGDVKFSRADIGKARRLLGYDPDVTFQQGLERTLKWHRRPAHGLAG